MLWPQQRLRELWLIERNTYDHHEQLVSNGSYVGSHGYQLSGRDLRQDQTQKILGVKDFHLTQRATHLVIEMKKRIRL